MREDILERKSDIEKWIQEGQSKAYMARELGCDPKTINPVLQKLGLSYDGNKGGKGLPKKRPKMGLIEYLEKSEDIQSNKVRIKLLEEGFEEHRCECCGGTEWLGKPIPLELHHKDGRKTNNSLENFELLCPNCHAFTDSYRGKNCAK
jgi:hypothetical protein